MRSTTTDGVNDFYRVTLIELKMRVFASRHDFPVYFDGHALSAQVEHFQQLAQSGLIVERAVFAVDGDVHSHGILHDLAPVALLEQRVVCAQWRWNAPKVGRYRRKNLPNVL